MTVGGEAPGGEAVSLDQPGRVEVRAQVALAEATPDGYREKGRFDLPKKTKLREGTNGKVWTRPVVIGGRLYLRDQDLLFCFDVKG